MLGLAHDVHYDDASVHRAWRKVVYHTHSDKARSSGAEDATKRANNAHDHLAAKSRRERYAHDLARALALQAEQEAAAAAQAAQEAAAAAAAAQEEATAQSRGCLVVVTKCAAACHCIVLPATLALRHGLVTCASWLSPSALLPCVVLSASVALRQCLVICASCRSHATMVRLSSDHLSGGCAAHTFTKRLCALCNLKVAFVHAGMGALWRLQSCLVLPALAAGAKAVAYITSRSMAKSGQCQAQARMTQPVT